MKRGIELLDNNGISVTMAFIVGFPGETAETNHNTAEFIRQIPYFFSLLEENNFFNRSLTSVQRKTLFYQRQKLTWQFIEQQPWDHITDTFADISRTMGF